MTRPAAAPPPSPARSRWLLPACLWGALLLGGCDAGPPPEEAARPEMDRLTREDGTDIFTLQSADPGMDAAVASARATLGTFHRYVDKDRDGTVRALIKGGFEAGENTEHMWVAAVTWDGRRFHGRLVSDPELVEGLSPGDPVELDPEQVSDWMVIADEVLLGGYTTLEIRRRLAPAERAAFDRTLPYRVVSDTALLRLPRPPAQTAP